MTKRDDYLRWKKQALDECGQCLGFRARGFDINVEEPETHICNPSSSCPGTCPALDLQENIHNPKTEKKLNKESANYIAQHCYKCGNSEDNAVLLPCRNQGESLWVCTKCLPSLIHG